MHAQHEIEMELLAIFIPYCTIHVYNTLMRDQQSHPIDPISFATVIMVPSSVNQTFLTHDALREWLVTKARDTKDETLRDRLENVNDLRSAIACVVRLYLDDVTLAAALGIRLQEMEGRLARLEASAERKSELVAAAMTLAELSGLTESDFTIALRAIPPPLIVSDEGAIPAAYWLPQAPILDREAVVKALRSGQAIPGADLGCSQPVISVRTS
jgi:hypothetical protein